METTRRIELVFGTETSFHLSRSVLYREIWVSPKITDFPAGLCPRVRQVNRVVDDQRVVAVYYKSVNCNPLTPLLRFVARLHNLLLQLTGF